MRHFAIAVWIIGALGLVACATRNGRGSELNGDANQGGGCGNGMCDLSAGESFETCSADCEQGADNCGDKTCQLDEGETCEGCAADCAALPACTDSTCGDGVIAGDEFCDDDNSGSFDGCSALCQVEKDFKCDGQPSLCGRAPALMGELVFSEIMPHPMAATDNVGEWIELYNTSSDTLNLEGLTIKNGEEQILTVGSVLIVPAGGYVVLGVEGDQTMNGGAKVDYEYSGLELADAGDTLTMLMGSLEIDHATYGVLTSTPEEGASVRVAPTHLTGEDNDLWTSWCADGATAFGAGDKGSPGAANAECPALPTPQTFTKSAMAALTGADFTSSINASAPGCDVRFLDVDIDIDYDWTYQLSIQLKDPAGTTVLLRDVYESTPLMGNYPSTLVLPPGESLGTFAGDAANGTWKLVITDDYGDGEGMLNSWTLHVYCR